MVSASNVALFVDLIAAGRDGDLKRAWGLQAQVNNYLVEIGTAAAQTEGDFISAVKKRLASQGFGTGVLTAPWRARP